MGLGSGMGNRRAARVGRASREARAACTSNAAGVVHADHAWEWSLTVEASRGGVWASWGAGVVGAGVAVSVKLHLKKCLCSSSPMNNVCLLVNHWSVHVANYCAQCTREQCTRVHLLNTSETGVAMNMSSLDGKITRRDGVVMHILGQVWASSAGRASQLRSAGASSSLGARELRAHCEAPRICDICDEHRRQ